MRDMFQMKEGSPKLKVSETRSLCYTVTLVNEVAQTLHRTERHSTFEKQKDDKLNWKKERATFGVNTILQLVKEIASWNHLLHCVFSAESGLIICSGVPDPAMSCWWRQHAVKLTLEWERDVFSCWWSISSVSDMILIIRGVWIVITIWFATQLGHSVVEMQHRLCNTLSRCTGNYLLKKYLSGLPWLSIIQKPLQFILISAFISCTQKVD